MSKTTCYKVKDGKIEEIPASVCNSKEEIGSYLNKGFVINKVTETKTNHQEKTVIETFSPRTRLEAWEEHKRQWGPGVPF